MMERRCLILICFIYSQVGLEEISAINNTHFVNATEGLFTNTTTNASRQSSVRDVKLNGTKLQTVIASELKKYGTAALLKSSSVLVTVIPGLQKTKQSSVNFVHPFINKSSTRKEMVQSHSRLESTFSPSSTSSPQSSSLLDTISIKYHQIQTTSSIQATQATSHLQNITLSCTEKTTDKLHSILETPSHTQISASPANSTYVSSILRDTNITIPFVQIIRGSFTSFIKLSHTIMNKGKTPSLSFNIKHSPIEAMTSSRVIKLKTSSSISLHPGNTSIYANKSHSSLKKVPSDINSPQPSVSLENSTTLAYTSSSTSKFIQDDSPSSQNTKYSSSVNFVNKISLQPTSYETKILASSSTTITSSLVARIPKTQSLSSEISTEIFKLLSTSLITPVKMETGDRMMTSSIYPTRTAAADGNVDAKKKKGENQGLPAWIAILSSIAVFIAIMTIVVVTCKYIRWNKDHGDYTLWISNLELQPITSRNAEVLT